MLKCACGVTFCLLMVGSAAAQNASVAVPKQQSASVRECLYNSEQERLLWEAAETWSRPSIPNAEQHNHQRIQIELSKQAPPTFPKLRREWLQPSPEAAVPESTATVVRR